MVATSLQPSRDEFLALARDHTVVPVWREVLADLETPVSAFVKLVGSAPSDPSGFLLESVEHAERQTPVPAWLRTGLLGLGVGGLLVGLTWPYLFGPLGAGVGVLITSFGAVALLIGGCVASWATRHVEVEPAV